VFSIFLPSVKFGLYSGGFEPPNPPSSYAADSSMLWYSRLPVQNFDELSNYLTLFNLPRPATAAAAATTTATA